MYVKECKDQYVAIKGELGSLIQVKMTLIQQSCNKCCLQEQLLLTVSQRWGFLFMLILEAVVDLYGVKQRSLIDGGFLRVLYVCLYTWVNKTLWQQDIL